MECIRHAVPTQMSPRSARYFEQVSESSNWGTAVAVRRFGDMAGRLIERHDGGFA